MLIVSYNNNSRLQKGNTILQTISLSTLLDTIHEIDSDINMEIHGLIETIPNNMQRLAIKKVSIEDWIVGKILLLHLIQIDNVVLPEQHYNIKWTMYEENENEENENAENKNEENKNEENENEENELGANTIKENHDKAYYSFRIAVADGLLHSLIEDQNLASMPLYIINSDNELFSKAYIIGIGKEELDGVYFSCVQLHTTEHK